MQHLREGGVRATSLPNTDIPRASCGAKTTTIIPRWCEDLMIVEGGDGRVGAQSSFILWIAVAFGRGMAVDVVSV